MLQIFLLKKPKKHKHNLSKVTYYNFNKKDHYIGNYIEFLKISISFSNFYNGD